MDEDFYDNENLVYDENDIEDFEDYISYYHLSDDEDGDEDEIQELYF